MRSTLIAVAAGLLVLLQPAKPAGQTPGQSPLRLAPLATYVEHEGTDTIGREVAYQVRELLSRSSTYPLQREIAGASVVIYLVSMEFEGRPMNASTAPERSSAVSYALTHDASTLAERRTEPRQLRFVTSGLLLLSRQRVDEIARSIVANLDASIRLLR
jgi:hypothetical protein